jgi:drug/metabolite transporter (DMT)-like permease
VPNKLPKMIRSEFFRSYLCLILASSLSSLGWILEAEAVAVLNPLVATTAALLCGGGLLCVFGFIREPRELPELKQVFSAPFLIFAILRTGLISLLMCYSLTLTSGTKAMFITKIEPYIVLLISVVWFGHRTTIQHIALLTLHILGAILLSTGGRLIFSLDTLGDLLIIIGVFISAVFFIEAQRYSHTFGAVYAAALSQLLGGLALLPFALIFCWGRLGLSNEYLIGWYYLGLTTLFFYVLSTPLWFASIRRIPAWLASALRAFGPVAATPIAWFVFDKRLAPLQLLGALIVVVTSAWMVVLERRDRVRVYGYKGSC